MVTLQVGYGRGLTLVTILFAGLALLFLVFHNVALREGSLALGHQIVGVSQHPPLVAGCAFLFPPVSRSLLIFSLPPFFPPSRPLRC